MTDELDMAKFFCGNTRDMVIVRFELFCSYNRVREDPLTAYLFVETFDYLFSVYLG